MDTDSKGGQLTTSLNEEFDNANMVPKQFKCEKQKFDL